MTMLERLQIGQPVSADGRKGRIHAFEMVEKERRYWVEFHGRIGRGNTWTPFYRLFSLNEIVVRQPTLFGGGE